MDNGPEVVGKALSTLGKGIAPAVITEPKKWAFPSRPNSTTQKPGWTRLIVDALRRVAGHSSHSWQQRPQTPDELRPGAP